MGVEWKKVEKFFGHCKIFWLAVIRRAIGGAVITYRVRVYDPPNPNHDFVRFTGSYERSWRITINILKKKKNFLLRYSQARIASNVGK